MQMQDQFLSHLKYFADNQKLWHQLFPCDPASDIADGFGCLLERLCQEERYELALQAVYACRSDAAVSAALTHIFVALLTDKIEREGLDAAKELCLTAFAVGPK